GLDVQEAALGRERVGEDHRDLRAVRRDHERGHLRDEALPGAHVPLQQPGHRAGAPQVPPHIGEGQLLAVVQRHAVLPGEVADQLVQRLVAGAALSPALPRPPGHAQLQQQQLLEGEAHLPPPRRVRREVGVAQRFFEVQEAMRLEQVDGERVFEHPLDGPKGRPH
ncbi:MAG: hypothetical protein ACK56I_23230, partial [bacterium]